MSSKPPVRPPLRPPSAASLPSGRACLLRIERIHQLLRAATTDRRCRVTIEILARDLEVSESTVKEDLTIFRVLFDPPIENCRKYRTKYYSRPFELRPLLWLEPEEVLSLLVATRLASHSRAFPLGRDLVRALNRIAPMLAGAASFGPDTLDPVFTSGDMRANDAEARHFARLCDAIVHCQEVRLTYLKAKPGSVTETRTVHPLHWFIRPDACLLILHEPEINDRRHFDLLRIRDVEPTGATFEPPAGFDLNHHLSGTFGRFVGPPRYEVLVRFEPEFVPFVRERPWQASQQLTDLPEGRAEALYRVCHAGDLEQYVLRTGDLAQVVSPTEVRDRIRNAAQTILARHS